MKTKQFIIEVPKGKTDCRLCPFYTSTTGFIDNKERICKYLIESNLCEIYDFTEMSFLKDKPTEKEILELENTEFDYGHNVDHKNYYED
jgi:hypothetical protein